MFFEIVRGIAGALVPIFVVSIMLNVGLTQRPTRFLGHLRNGRFLARMLLANLVVVPALMVLATTVVELEPIYRAGLIVFGLAAGAPFLIALTKQSENDISLAATVMTVLIVGTVIVMPIALPLLLEGVTVDARGIIGNLLLQMILPMVVGMLLLQFFESFAAVIQPWVARIGQWALYAMMAAMIVGYLDRMADRELWKAILTGLVVIVVALLVGYAMGGGRVDLNEVGGLATAQRNTAAAMIVAAQNFSDPRVVVVVTLVNGFGILILLGAAKTMSRDTYLLIEPIGADMPQRRSKRDVDDDGRRRLRSVTGRPDRLAGHAG